MHFNLDNISRKAGFTYAAPVILALVIFCAFFPVLGADFINYDDQEYVTENAALAGGISLDALKWSVTALHSNNWHPLTWISHMVDIQLYGLNPTGHHVTNLMIHMANSLLVALLLLRLSGDKWKSWLLAALFALHPLRVESVAWVAERKDLLCGFFWLLAITLYLRYVQRKTAASYLLMTAAVICSLLAKPMAVTLPLILLLLDLWPLKRFRTLDSRLPWPVILEKAPLIACSMAVSLVTLKAQAQAINIVEPAARVGNALCSYVVYLWKYLVPAGLAPFYPYRPHGLLLAAAAGLLLLIITGVCLAARNRKPQLLVGWSWYIVTLIPVIGVIQVGNQALADRYTYLPSIGLLIVLMGVLPEKFFSRTHLRAMALVLLAILSSATFVQATYWRDSTTLFRHTLAVTETNYLAHYSLGSALLQRGEVTEAEIELRKAIEIEPDFCVAWSRLGVLYGMAGRVAEAADVLQTATVCDPMSVDAHYNLGIAWAELGAQEKVQHEYQVLYNLNPKAAEKLQLRMR